MAALWTKNPDGTWVQSTLYAAVGASSGANSWRYASKVFEKTGASTWTQRWTRTTTPPSAPTLSYTTIPSAHTAQIKITIPNDPNIVRMLIKVSKDGSYPSVAAPVSEPTATYYSFLAADGTVWGSTTVTANQVLLRDIGGMVAGSTYYYSCWVQDINGNWSLPAKLTYKYPAVAAPNPVPVVKTAYILCNDSASWMGDDNYWRTDNNYVYQAGRDSYGMWFYSTAIQSALAKATRILDINVTVGRVNSSHGVAGESNVRLSYHKYASQPSGSPEGTMPTGTLVGTLARGEQVWFHVPDTWWPGLKSGAIRGFGLRYGTSTFTDNDYMIAYGKGTYSGRVFLQWEE